ncbi:MAG: hypothetical protein WCE46_09420 [Methanoregula sp.]|jgi:hypothetical protein
MMPGLVKSEKPSEPLNRNWEPSGYGSPDAVKKEEDAIPAKRAIGSP